MIRFTILGEPASKANSREIVTFGRGENKRAAVIKSEKARDYEADALKQIPPRFRLRLEGPMRVTITVYYASRRPDLDESVILDVMQDRYGKAPKVNGKAVGARPLIQSGVYRNDRQVDEKHIFRSFKDPKNPRAEILVEPLQAQQQGLDLAPAPFADQLDPVGMQF